ncbi:unnamed protein product [Phytomonas sp. Hart1]|nr:unnamed protein product [Phytomonas sp. Hart1]|eukprot:CCW67614.1 unnamed protein product [Phytomonas sp. isolate Hart1]
MLKFTIAYSSKRDILTGDKEKDKTHRYLRKSAYAGADTKLSSENYNTKAAAKPGMTPPQQRFTLIHPLPSMTNSGNIDVADFCGVKLK